jgi:hypothetical protein
MQTRVIGSGGGYLPWKSHPKAGALFQRIHKEKVCACVLCVSKRVTRVNAGKRLSCFGGCDAYLFLKSGESAPSALSRRLSIGDKSIYHLRDLFAKKNGQMYDQTHFLCG